ncbi:MAG: hypothetical protein IPO95_07525 [Rhodanobacteraceae bacterium]|nr:hypothetical protein [Rhodanobacteraceae bacterium]
MRGWLSLVVMVLAGTVRAELVSVPIRSATLTLQWNADSLRELDLAVPKHLAVQSLQVRPDLRLVLRDGQSVALRGAAFGLADDWEFDVRGRRQRAGTMQWVVSRGEAFEFALRDADGRDWLRFDHAHPQRRDGGTRAEWRHFDVHVGPGLAQRLGDARLIGVPIGSALLHMELTSAAKAIDSCVAPNFPTTGNFQVDVALSAIDGADAICNGACNGAGAANARIKLTPSAKLQGVGSADVPWYQKFMTSPHGYPYPGNDQHPYLVWAVYRIDADGRIEQLARSGVKHAFFSSNEYPAGGAGCGCGGANVLWAGCTDTYGWSTNDSSAFLAPRAEIIPSRGQWGRCGSLRDADCNGSEDGPFIPNFELRAVVVESELVPALHPGAQWFIEAWYVVRDDVNVDNSFGHRRIFPRWVAPTGKWMLDFFDSPGGSWLPFVPGPVIDAWVAPGTTTATRMSREAVAADGRVRLAVRVADLGGGRWRYDYALMNIDPYAAPDPGQRAESAGARQSRSDRVRAAAVAVRGGPRRRARWRSRRGQRLDCRAHGHDPALQRARGCIDALGRAVSAMASSATCRRSWATPRSSPAARARPQRSSSPPWCPIPARSCSRTAWNSRGLWGKSRTAASIAMTLRRLRCATGCCSA